jgi:glycosyltransferase involved in cell wall biosynthesis
MIIHCFGMPHLLAAAAARAAGIENVVVKAGNPPPADRAARRRWRVVIMASRVLGCPIFSCSYSVDYELRKLHTGMPPGSAPLPNGIDVFDLGLVASRARLMRPPMGPIIGMIARLDPIKDHATLIRAFALVQRNLPEAQLWIIGDGALRQRLEAIVEENKVAAATRFFGDRTDIADLLGQIDFYAFSTTRDEGFGIALIEAMAAGVPIVATDVPACREVLANGEAGVLVPPGDPAAMASAILTLIRDDEACRQMVVRADNRVRSEYSIERNARRWASKLFGDSPLVQQVDQCAS